LWGQGRNDFLSAFTFCQLWKQSHVETSVNWQNISDLFQLYFRTPNRLVPWTAAHLACPIIQPCTHTKWNHLRKRRLRKQIYPAQNEHWRTNLKLESTQREIHTLD
jgi:hypothetical protein